MTIRLALVTLALLALTGLPAFACPDDSDGDGTCDALDNCPAVANQMQSDIDGDSAGDACDANDAVLVIKALRIKADTSASSDNGYVKLKGEFVTTPPDDRFFLATGPRLRVVDGGGFDFFYGLGQGDCGMVSSGRWLCIDPNRHMKLTARAKSSPNAHRIAISVTKMPIAGPFTGAVTATISQDDDIDRVGSASICKTTATKHTCK